MTDSTTESRRRTQRAYQHRNHERLAERSKAWRIANPEAARLHRRKHHLAKYGLTLADFEAMLARQDGVCAICHKPETQVVKGTLSSLKVDHDHLSGHVRGLLCNSCNMRLGRLVEDSTWLESALSYLGACR